MGRSRWKADQDAELEPSFVGHPQKALQSQPRGFGKIANALSTFVWPPGDEYIKCGIAFATRFIEQIAPTCVELLCVVEDIFVGHKLFRFRGLLLDAF